VAVVAVVAAFLLQVAVAVPVAAQVETGAHQRGQYFPAVAVGVVWAVMVAMAQLTFPVQTLLLAVVVAGENFLVQHLEQCLLAAKTRGVGV
jgi:hypothetical protein